MMRGIRLTVLAFAMAIACTEKNRDDSQDAEPALEPVLKTVVYTEDTAFQTFELARLIFEFTGEDLKDPIFARITGHPKEQLEPAHACTGLVPYVQPGLRLRLFWENDTTDILASADLGCSQAASPDLTGVIPTDLLTEVYAALKPKALSRGYEKNNIAVYWKGDRMLKADAASFGILAGDYASDKTQIFFQGQVLDDSDRNSFVTLSKSWAKDLNHAYFNGVKVEGVDLPSLTLSKQHPAYALDATRVYYLSRLINGLDPNNFACFHEHFCRNDSQVVFLETILRNVDAGTFAVDVCDFHRSPTPTASLSSLPPRKPSQVFCKVHDKNGNYVLEHKDPLETY